MTLLPAALATGNIDAQRRRNVCARRSRPASARGFLGQPGQHTVTSSWLRLAPARMRSGCSIAGRKTASFDSYRNLTATGLTLGYSPLISGAGRNIPENATLNDVPH